MCVACVCICICVCGFRTSEVRPGAGCVPVVSSQQSELCSVAIRELWVEVGLYSTVC